MEFKIKKSCIVKMELLKYHRLFSFNDKSRFDKKLAIVI